MLEGRGMKEHKGRLYGPYRAIVKDNRDPLKIGRLKVACPSVYGLDEKNNPIVSDWIYPAQAIAGNDFGMFMIPPVMKNGSPSLVWIMFEMGDVNKPIWFGSPYAMNNKISEANPKTRKREDGTDRKEPNNFCFVTPRGHSIEFDDDEIFSKIKLTDLYGNVIILSSKQGDEKILLQHKGGAKIEMRSNEILLDATNLRFKGAISYE